MRLVLDSNEYVFGFGSERKGSSERLLASLATTPARHEIRLPRTILEEVRRNLPGRAFERVWTYLNALGIVPDEDWVVPFETGWRYETAGLKPGDAFIAAYAEWARVDCLVTENRDFLQSKELPFIVLKAEEFLKRHAS